MQDFDSTDAQKNHLAYQQMIESFVAQKNDKGALLLSLLGKYIRNFSSSKFYLTEEDQKDVLQNIGIKIYQNHHKVKTNYYGWTFAIAYNECITRMRVNSSSRALVSMSSSKEILSIEGDEIQLPALPDNLTDTLDCFEYIFDEIVKQSGLEHDRDIYFQYVLGKTNEEISEQTGRTSETIARRISILKSRVKELFIKFC